MTAYADLDTAIDALRAGAADFLLKPFSLAQVLNAIQRCFERSRLARENFVLRREISTHAADIEGRRWAVGVDDQGLRAAQAHCANAGYCPALRRIRHRQGGRRACPASHEQPGRRPFRAGQLRCDRRRVDRVGAVRPHQGGLYRRPAEPRGPVLLRPGRHAVSRRNLRTAACCPGQVAAGCWRSGVSGRLVRSRKSPSMCASSPPPTAT